MARIAPNNLVLATNTLWLILPPHETTTTAVLKAIVAVLRLKMATDLGTRRGILLPNAMVLMLSNYLLKGQPRKPRRQSRLLSLSHELLRLDDELLFDPPIT